MRRHAKIPAGKAIKAELARIRRECRSREGLNAQPWSAALIDGDGNAIRLRDARSTAASTQSQTIHWQLRLLDSTHRKTCISVRESLRSVLAMTRLKEFLVLGALASWFVAAVFFVNGSVFRYAVLFVVTAYALAMLLMALSALVRSGWNKELTLGPERRFLLLGPPGLAAAFSVALVVDLMKCQNLCSAFDDCLSLKAFKYHIAIFLMGLIRIALQFYAIMGLAALFIRSIQMIEKFRRRWQCPHFCEEQKIGKIRS